MKLLLDTHIALWALTDDPKLPAIARRLIEDESNDIYVSAASAWEVSIKHATHPDKMLVDSTAYIGYCIDAGFRQLPISHVHVSLLETPQRPEGSPQHNDPFDRIMLAQAKFEGMLFITHDALMADYNEPCIMTV